MFNTPKNISKCIRLPKEVINKANKICKKKHITFSKLTELALIYTLENLDNKNK